MNLITQVSQSAAFSGVDARSLLFIDAGVEAIPTLIQHAAAGTEVHVLRSGPDAVAQITQTLSGRSDIASLQIVSHGRSGGLKLGESWLDLQTLPSHVNQLKSWGAALSADADILLYGCNVAAGEVGRSFVDLLAQVTGADVAASEDLTGNAALGGDWDLEVKTGAIDTASVFSDNVSHYQNLLGDPVFAQALQLTSGGLGDLSKTAVDNLGNRYTIGTFSGVVDFDPSLTGVANRINGEGEGDIFISKLDSVGNFVWAKAMGTGAYGNAAGIAVDAGGNIYISGSFTGTIDIDPSPTSVANLVSAGEYDIFITKLDSRGDLIWGKSIGGANYDLARGVAIDGSGNVYTVGTFKGTVDFDPSLTGTSNLSSSINEDTSINEAFISKLDSSGNFVWAKSIGDDRNLFNYGYPISVAIDGSGNVYTAGAFEGTADFDPSLTETANLVSAGESDIFISKLDSRGNFIWAKSIGGTGRDAATGLTIDGSGNIYTTGYFYDIVDFDPSLTNTNNLFSLGGNASTFVSKLDRDGNFAWAKSWEGLLYYNATGIAVDAGGDIYTTGTFIGTVDFDPSPTGITNLVSLDDGRPNLGLSKADIFISKLDNRGDFVWAKAIGGPSSDFAASIAIDGRGNVYTTGSFTGTVDFDPSLTGTANLQAGNGTNLFLSKFTTAGDFVQVQQFTSGAASGDFSKTVVDNLGNRYTIGTFRGTVDFDPSLTGVSNLVSTGGVQWYLGGLFDVGGADIFINKLDSRGNFVWAKALNGTLRSRATDIAIDDLGNLYITGSFTGTVDADPSLEGTSRLSNPNDGSADIYTNNPNSSYPYKTDILIAKLDNRGNLVWAKSIGGTETDNATHIAVDHTGAAYITGTFQGTVDFDPSLTGTTNLVSAAETGSFLSKLDSNGNFVWAKDVSERMGNINDLTIDRNGDVYTLADRRIDKLDGNGNSIWVTSVGLRITGGYLLSRAAVFNVKTDTNGNLYITGGFSGTVDLGGNLVDSIALYTSYGQDVDFFIWKLDSQGKSIWVKTITAGNEMQTYGSANAIRINDLAIDRRDNTYTTGIFSGTVDFDPSPTGTSNLVSESAFSKVENRIVTIPSIFIRKLDSNGNFVWAQAFARGEGNYPSSIAIDAADNVYTTGFFSRTTDFDPGANIVNLQTGGIFFSKLSQGNQGQFTYGANFGPQTGQIVEIGPAWTIAATGDFNRDGIDDVLLHTQSGDEVKLWTIGPNAQVMAIQSITGSDGNILKTGNLNWKVVGFVDIDRDNILDIVWHNPVSDEVGFWFMNSNGISVRSYDYLRDGTGAILKTGNPLWQVKGVADFDGDGDADLLFRLPELNQTAIVRLNGPIVTDAQYITANADATLQIRGIADSDGDRIPDIYWQSPDQRKVLVQTIKFQGGKWLTDDFALADPTLPLAIAA
jgi:Domain of unknown function (DUF4347)/Beta-propeller repeat